MRRKADTEEDLISYSIPLVAVEFSFITCLYYLCSLWHFSPTNNKGQDVLSVLYESGTVLVIDVATVVASLIFRWQKQSTGAVGKLSNAVQLEGSRAEISPQTLKFQNLWNLTTMPYYLLVKLAKIKRKSQFSLVIQ